MLGAKKIALTKISRVGIITLILVFALMALAVPGASAKESTHELVIMSTTDIHAHVMHYDYMKDSVDEGIGLAKVATLVQQVRGKYPNTILVDAGDVIQGSILGDLEALVKPIQKGDLHAVIGSMNMMGYDAVCVGNHEFNYGLDFLKRAYEGAQFPLVNANVYQAGTEDNYFTPYVILEREVDGNSIKIGIIGFVPPQIMIWDKIHLEGRVYTKGIVETAKKFIPEMKAEGADLIIALAHTGIDAREGASENAAYYLSQVEGIDAMILGHQHLLFPNSSWAGIEGIDIEKGLINGVPAVMAGAWGNNLGLIKLELGNVNGVWEVRDSKSELIGVTEVNPRTDIVSFVEKKHQATIEYINNFVGETVARLNTFFARVMENKVVQLINDAQIWFANNYFKGTEYENMPLLSAAAPFKAGRGGPGYFTDVAAGGITIKDVADIYMYSNILEVVKVNAEELKSWLEVSAANFNQIDPTATEDQVLLDYSFRGYNFDTIKGIKYQIDITKPVGERITNITYQGKPLTSEMEFLVVTNNYRASGGGYHLVDAEVVLSSTEENRGVIINYIREMGKADPQITNNWSILPVETAGRLIFRASPDGKDYIESEGLTNVAYVGEEEGWGIYAYNLQETSTKSSEAKKIITMTIGQKNIADGLDVAPFIKNNRTYAPLRYFSEALGAVVNWDAGCGTVTITIGQQVIVLDPGSEAISVNGMDRKLSEAPLIKDGRTFIQVHEISKVFDFEVVWDEKSQSVTIMK